MTFQKILVALDQSRQADQVFAQALDLAQKEGGQVLVFHALQWTPAVRSSYFLETGLLGNSDIHHPISALHPGTLQADLERANSWLQTCANQATTQGIPTQCILRLGNPSSAICDIARNWGADLIVVSRRDHSKFPEILLGSVSNYVLHGAPCSVLVLQGDKHAVDDPTATTQAEGVSVGDR